MYFYFEKKKHDQSYFKTLVSFQTMLLAIVFHAYFDVDIEELLSERKHYVCDKVSVFVDQVLVRVGFNKKAEKRKNKRLHNELGHITYQDIYKILKRYGVEYEQTWA